jgi:DNA-binding PadR family transcriptional regulator
MSNIILTEAVYYILLSLEEPLHGYGIIKNVEKLSGGRVRLAPGTLYGALNTLKEKHWIEELPVKSESRKKEYQITYLGKMIVLTEIRRLQDLLHNGESVIKNWEI